MTPQAGTSMEQALNGDCDDSESESPQPQKKARKLSPALQAPLQEPIQDEAGESRTPPVMHQTVI